MNPYFFADAKVGNLNRYEDLKISGFGNDQCLNDSQDTSEKDL